MPRSPQDVLTNKPQGVISSGLHQLGNVKQDGVWRERLQHSEGILCCEGVGWVLLGEICHGLNRGNGGPTQHMRQLWDIRLNVLFCDEVLTGGENSSYFELRKTVHVSHFHQDRTMYSF